MALEMWPHTLDNFLHCEQHGFEGKLLCDLMIAAVPRLASKHHFFVCSGPSQGWHRVFLKQN